MGVIFLLLVWDGVSAILSSALGLCLALPGFSHRWQYALATLLVAWVCFALFGAYRQKLQPAIFSMPLRLVAASLAAGFSIFLLPGEWAVTPAVLVLTFTPLCALALAGRILLSKDRPQRQSSMRAAVYGAGELGHLLVDRFGGMQGPRPVLFLDDDPAKKGTRYKGVRVVGGLEALPRLVGKVDCLVVAIDRLSPRRLKEAIQLAATQGLPLKRFGLFDQQEEMSAARLGEIHPEDLLRRETVDLDATPLCTLLAGKTVLVTGGAGSIGSELCRQALQLGAGHLVAFDISENGLFQLGRELFSLYPADRCTLEVGSVRDKSRMNQLMEQYRPAIVLHAAAHKHVPIMEFCPSEAVKNNLLGTKAAAEAAIASGAELFVLISTDKAVNPSSVMGATKRGAELCLQLLWGRHPATRFCAVRFGNVLDSQGSVVPIFREQIARGGPVTVTHREMRRYFMTIPEAVQLVLHAAALSQGGETFTLDMGEPVAIYDLACDMIRLCGYRPHQDIEIQFTGPRPGEKLLEELELPEEETHPTSCPRISAFSWGKWDFPAAEELLEELKEAASAGDDSQVLALLHQLVPTYRNSHTEESAPKTAKKEDG